MDPNEKLGLTHANLESAWIYLVILLIRKALSFVTLSNYLFHLLVSLFNNKFYWS